LIVAVEKGAIKGVIAERGTTRIVVAGDSLFLVNGPIENVANRDLAGYIVNWLVDRPQLLEGLSPRPVAEYRLVMTRGQMQGARLVLLAGMPGALLAVGALVAFRRRDDVISFFIGMSRKAIRFWGMVVLGLLALTLIQGLFRQRPPQAPGKVLPR